jgi:hypothetical protein
MISTGKEYLNKGIYTGKEYLGISLYSCEKQKLKIKWRLNICKT